MSVPAGETADEPADPDEAVVESLRAAVAEAGYQIALVPSFGGRCAYGFTIGLSSSYAHPELVVIGLDEAEPDGLMHELLEAAADSVADGSRYQAGSTDHRLLDGHTLALRQVTPEHCRALLDTADRVLGREVEALQLIWPDARGLMPWSSACDARVREQQPLLDGSASVS